MLLVITRPELAAGKLQDLETGTIRLLLQAGLSLLHLRKPEASLAALTGCLSGLSIEERRCIVLHPPSAFFQQLDIEEGLLHICSQMQRWGVTRLHIPAWLREGFKGDLGNLLSGCTRRYPELCFSTGIHMPAVLELLLANKKTAAGFQYILVSPLCRSISKPGYAPQNLRHLDELWRLPRLHRDGPEEKCRLIGMGGVCAENLPQIRKAGFDGAACLGAVWQPLNPETCGVWQKQALDQFEICRKAWTD